MSTDSENTSFGLHSSESPLGGLSGGHIKSENEDGTPLEETINRCVELVRLPDLSVAPDNSCQTKFNMPALVRTLAAEKLGRLIFVANSRRAEDQVANILGTIFSKDINQSEQESFLSSLLNESLKYPEERDVLACVVEYIPDDTEQTMKTLAMFVTRKDLNIDLQTREKAYRKLFGLDGHFAVITALEAGTLMVENDIETLVETLKRSRNGINEIMKVQACALPYVQLYFDIVKGIYNTPDALREKVKEVFTWKYGPEKDTTADDMEIEYVQYIGEEWEAICGAALDERCNVNFACVRDAINAFYENEMEVLTYEGLRERLTQ